MREGIEVPLYFQIGQWPSVEMAVDYLAWGFFMGLAFICLSRPLISTDKEVRGLRTVSLINGILCIAGFIGALFINENIWYLAPMGYGIGIVILCVMAIRIEKNKKLVTKK
jgi:cyanate permease